MDDVLFNLRRFLSPEIIVGKDAMTLIGRHAKNLAAKKVFLVSDHGVAVAGLTARAQSSLEQYGISFTTFLEVSENPKDTEVEKGLEQYLEEGCDLIVAVGGGSPMDCAKAIGVLATNPGRIGDFAGINKVPHPIPPLIFVPTTAGSSADVSQYAIITLTKEKKKIGIISSMIIPDISLVDHATTISLPLDITVATAMDALCHAYEAYVSKASSHLTDVSAIEAIRLIFTYLPQLYKEPDNLTLRSHIMMGSLLAGLAFSNAGLGLTHSMSHAVGGLYDSSHGECNGIFLEKVIAFNYIASQEKHREIAEVLKLSLGDNIQEDNGVILAKHVEKFRLSVGLNKRGCDLGVKKEDITFLSEGAILDVCTVTNPRTATVEDFEMLFNQLL
ncbi:MAG: iron-containing alcohol dehydrogenase [Desulfotalea sp.]